jgi:hypothetical protein
MDALTEIGGTPLEHPPYSPHLTPCDFWDFPTMKSSSACSTILLKLAVKGLLYILEKWVERCKKCIACQGRYFEKETVTAPTKFRLGVIRRVHEIFKRPSYFIFDTFSKGFTSYLLDLKSRLAPPPPFRVVSFLNEREAHSIS